MADFKAMYYHLAGRMAATVEVLDMTNKILDTTVKSLKSYEANIRTNTKTLIEVKDALGDLKDKLALAQQHTEEMFMDSEDDSEDLG